MAYSKPLENFTLLETELKHISKHGLLLLSFNIYSQFKSPQMGAFILELAALEIACHAGGLVNYETTKRWTEPIWDVDELKRILAEDILHNNPMCHKLLLVLQLQDKIAATNRRQTNYSHLRGLVWESPP
jgi:hypothetical protein